MRPLFVLGFCLCLLAVLGVPALAQNTSPALQELERFRSLVLSGDALENQGDLKAAAGAYENDLQAADTAIKEIVALQRLARILAYTKQLGPAIERLSQADTRLQEAFGDDHVYRIDIMKTAVMVYSYLGNREQALAAHRIAVALIKRHADAWSISADSGHALHRLSGAIVPATLGPMTSSQPVALEINGNDVAADYKAEGLRMTVYFTRGGRPDTLDQAFEQTKDVMMMQYRSSLDAAIVAEGKVSAVVPAMPGNGRYAVAEYTNPTNAKKMRSSLHLFHDGTWSIKVRFTYTANKKGEANKIVEDLWSVMTWPTKG